MNTEITRKTANRLNTTLAQAKQQVCNLYHATTHTTTWQYGL